MPADSDIPPSTGAGGEGPAKEPLAVRRPVAVTMVFLALAVFGWQSLKKLPLNLMPDITYPSLTVRTEMEGAAPEEVEDLISEPVEEALGTVSDLVQISSTSSAGASEVVLEFAWDKNMDFAVLDVREKLDRVVFPKEAERPLILRYNPSLDPIMRIGVYGELDLFELRELAEEEIKRELEGISGVASAQVKGGLEEEIRIEVDEARAARLGVTVLGVGEQLALQNINLAGGKLKEGKVEYLVRTLNEFLDPKEIEDIVVGGASGGADVVRLRDVATVRRDHRDRKTITRIGGREAVLISIYKEADANTVAAVRAVRDKMAELFGEKAAAAPARADGEKGLVRQATLAANIPEGARYEVISDQARFIESAIAEVKDAAVQGGALSIVVLLLFLRDWRSTLILALSLPISVIITFIPMFALGTSLNIMSLGGLALGIGMLVDNGVVVIENIFRLREEGVPIREAASRGVSEVSGPIISGTFTNVAVFLPIVFVEGVAGQLFWDFAVTVTFSVLASLLPALFLVPMLVAQQQALEEWAGGRGESAWVRRLVERRTDVAGVVGEAKTWLRAAWAEARFAYFRDRPAAARVALAPVALGLAAFQALVLVARVALAAVGQAALAVVYAALGAAALAWGGLSRLVGPVLAGPLGYVQDGLDRVVAAYPRLLGWCMARRASVLATAAILFAVGAGFVPGLGQELIPRMHQGEFGVLLEKAVGTPLAVTADAAAPVEAVLREDPDVESVFAEIGAVSQEGMQERETEGEERAQLTVRLKGTEDNVYREEAVIGRLREKLAAIGGMTMKIVEPSLFSFKTPIEVEIEGWDLDTLKRLGRDAQAALERVPGLVDVKTSLSEGSPEVHVAFDAARMQYYRLSVGDAAGALRDKVLGRVPTQFTEGERKIDIRVKANESEISDLDALRDLTIGFLDGRPVPLRAVADVSVRPGPSEVRRVGQRRVALVSANLQGTDLRTASEAADAALAGASKSWPRGYAYRLGGQNREWATSYRALQFAMLLAIFLVYILMAAEFESLTEPFIIMFTVPLAMVGVLYGMKLFDLNISVVTLIGVIVLIGIVDNNAIVLIDRINQLLDSGHEFADALAKAGRQRLRPILMTTLTTVLGLVPMALGLGDGAEIRRPMAIVVITGLATATFLTLVIVPILYSYVTRRARWAPGGRDPDPQGAPARAGAEGAP